MTERGRSFRVLGIALAAGAVGYLVGVLSAPASGRDTRRRLGHRLEDEKDELVRKAEDTLRGAKRTLSHVVRG